MLGTVCRYIQNDAWLRCSYYVGARWISMYSIFLCEVKIERAYLGVLERPLLNISPSSYRDDEECIFYTCPGDDEV